MSNGIAKTTVAHMREKVAARIDRKLDKYVIQELAIITKDVERWQKDLHKENKNHFGRPRKYSDSLISSLVYMKNYFNLTLRETEALAIMLFGSEFTPDHDTIRERMNNIKINLNISTKINKEIAKLADR